jgi:ACR3 family arsenite efflux pump ArsB
MVFYLFFSLDGKETKGQGCTFYATAFFRFAKEKELAALEGTEKVLFRFFGNQIIQHISIKRLGYVLFFLYLYNYKSIRYASIATSHTVQ